MHGRRGVIPKQKRSEGVMARTSDIEKMSYTEPKEMETRIQRQLIQKRDQERAELKEKMAALARESGFDLRELLGGGRGRKGMTVSVKYRDPENPENTWTGRGRMPRWLAAVTKGGKVKKDDFLVG
jgi:DNA-binding protein H-NS